jgi:hypothetical protein
MQRIRDGKTLATGSRNATVRAYALDVQELLRIGCARVTRNLPEREWTLYVSPDVPCRETCPDLPVPPESE